MSAGKSRGNMVRVGRRIFALATLSALVLALVSLSKPKQEPENEVEKPRDWRAGSALPLPLAISPL